MNMNKNERCTIIIFSSWYFLIIKQILQNFTFRNETPINQPTKKPINKQNKFQMDGVISTLVCYFLKAILVILDALPFSRFWTCRFIPTGVIKILVHRAVLERKNIYKSEFYFIYFMNSTLVSFLGRKTAASYFILEVESLMIL